MTNALLTMKEGKLYGADDSETMMFDFENALFVGIGTQSHTRGCGGVFTFKMFSIEVPKIIQKAAEMLACGENDLVVKIVGLNREILLAKALLESRGVTIAALRSTSTNSGQGFFYPLQNRLRIAKHGPSPIATSHVTRQLRIGIIDDSKTIRTLLKNILSSDPSFSVLWEASSPSEALRLIASNQPDVITLDIHMPEMNGVELLKAFISDYPIPTIVITSLSMEEGPLVLDALECGAIDYVQKPSSSDLGDVARLIIEKIKAISEARPVAAKSPNQVLRRATAHSIDKDLVVAIGSSTGGTEALKSLLTNLPDEIPPILIVQHIPAIFSLAFANRLNDLCPFEVKEAANGDEVRPGRVLVAPGGFQMRLKRSSKGFTVVVEDSAPVNRHKPSVDVLFDSVAREVGANAIGVILTGMGNDGAKGLLNMKNAGARTAGQDESTCVVYGMPREAAKLGAIEKVARLDDLPQILVNWFDKNKSKKKAIA